MQRRTFITTVAAAAVTATAGCVAGGDGDDPGSGDGATDDTEQPPSITSQSLERREECPNAGAASISTQSQTVVVEGCIVGSDGCKEPMLENAAYDADADKLTVTVGTEDRENADACTQALVDLGYRATVAFDGRLPGTTVVVHKGANGEKQTAEAQTN